MDKNVTESGNRKTLAEAFKTSAPIMVSYIVLGMGFGFLLQRAGFGPLWAFFMSVIIFGGTMQYVGVSLLAGPASYLTVALTSVMVQIRHLFYGISMIQKYKDEGARKWYLFYAVTDEVYAVLSGDSVPEGTDPGRYRMYVSLMCHSSWIFGSTLGAALGTVLAFDSTGMDFAMTALFITVYVEQWIDSKCHIPALTGLLGTAACRLLFGADLFLIPSMIIIVVVLTVMRKTITERSGTPGGRNSGDAGEVSEGV
jgi:4-azaleucine resistance transporter AzlC